LKKRLNPGVLKVNCHMTGIIEIGILSIWRTHDVLPRRITQNRQLTEIWEGEGKRMVHTVVAAAAASASGRSSRCSLVIHVWVEVVRVPVDVRRGSKRGANGTQTHREVEV
jgi:hypothetical protein